MSAFKSLSIGLSMLLLSACATTTALDERDPWEGFNRGVYSFNQTMDDVVFNPIGKVYNAVTPDVIDTGVTNFFGNLGQIPVIANDILQFKFGQAVNDSVRFLINSTLGLFGFFDILADSELQSSGEDFGQTLAHWGMGSGPYVVLPFFGPATVRDAVGFGADSFLSPIAHLDSDTTRAGLLSLNYIDFKSDILTATDLLKDAALDEYNFTKNAYFEKRESQINNGNGESSEFSEEFLID
jgi:phospholipid-binding lipoprotein MlaA